MKGSKSVNYLYRITRAEEWKDTKLSWLYIALGMVFLKSGPGFIEQIKLIVLYTLLSAVFFASVAIANDYADKETDQKVGKDKLLYDWSQKKFLGTMITLFLFYSLLIFSLSQNIVHIFLSIFLFIFGALGYSLKPLRLKEKGFLGILTGDLLRVVPLLLLFLFQGSFGLLETAFLFFVTVLGLRQMFIHQIKDLVNDETTDTNTFVVKTNKNTSVFIAQKLILPTEVIFLLFLIYLYGTIVSNTIYLLAVIYIIFWSFLYIFRKKVFSKINQLSTTNSFLADFYFFWWPIFTGLLVFWKLDSPFILLITLYLQKWHLVNLAKKVV